MKRGLLNYSHYSFKKNEKAACIFLLKLLILLFFLKTIFYFYNAPLTGISSVVTTGNILKILKWSIAYDAMVLLMINTPFIVSLALLSLFNRKKPPVILVTAIFFSVNFICVLLNMVDVFYYHFHLQRADADLLYVIQHPFQKAFLKNFYSTIIGLVIAVALFFLLFQIHKKLLHQYYEGKKFFFAAAIMSICCLAFFLSGRNKLIPTHPLVELNSIELQFVQNSFHTFTYSVYRKDEAIVHLSNYIPDSVVHILIPVHKAAQLPYTIKKNIVLFIMESVPEDFFNVNGKYNVMMPFLDSLVSVSKYYSNAYSFGRSSNKGITSILAGIPTLTEIPLYHSNYASIKITSVGNSLATRGYTSSFFIGDDFDDFGFAKCVNWLGIQHYYSKENISGHKSMDNHTMGLHDEYVLDFMGEKINTMQQPFLAVNYNISTHYPNNLPKGYKEKFPQSNFSNQMKSMSYYNECLKKFFHDASQKPWFANTVFIFCSDHWMDPDARYLTNDVVQSFHIPIIIYEPLNSQGKVITAPVSQFDILNTILSVSGNTKPFISYGENLLQENPDMNRVVFSKQNTVLCLAFDSSYVLGFNSVTGKPEYCFNYKTDMNKRNNLVNGPYNARMDSLTIYMKAFLQMASNHYNKSGAFK